MGKVSFMAKGYNTFLTNQTYLLKIAFLYFHDFNIFGRNYNKIPIELIIWWPGSHVPVGLLFDKEQKYKKKTSVLAEHAHFLNLHKFHSVKKVASQKKKLHLVQFFSVESENGFSNTCF